jgi:hypothetical protein
MLVVGIMDPSAPLRPIDPKTSVLLQYFTVSVGHELMSDEWDFNQIVRAS